MIPLTYHQQPIQQRMQQTHYQQTNELNAEHHELSSLSLNSRIVEQPHLHQNTSPESQVYSRNEKSGCHPQSTRHCKIDELSEMSVLLTGGIQYARYAASQQELWSQLLADHRQKLQEEIQQTRELIRLTRAQNVFAELEETKTAIKESKQYLKTSKSPLLPSQISHNRLKYLQTQISAKKKLFYLQKAKEKKAIDLLNEKKIVFPLVDYPSKTTLNRKNSNTSPSITKSIKSNKSNQTIIKKPTHPYENSYREGRTLHKASSSRNMLLIKGISNITSLRQEGRKPSTSQVKKSKPYANHSQYTNNPQFIHQTNQYGLSPVSHKKKGIQKYSPSIKQPEQIRHFILLGRIELLQESLRFTSQTRRKKIEQLHYQNSYMYDELLSVELQIKKYEKLIKNLANNGEQEEEELSSSMGLTICKSENLKIVAQKRKNRMISPNRIGSNLKSVNKSRIKSAYQIEKEVYLKAKPNIRSLSRGSLFRVSSDFKLRRLNRHQSDVMNQYFQQTNSKINKEQYRPRLGSRLLKINKDSSFKS